jgi:transcriptional regulator with XRE-family HTH domain
MPHSVAELCREKAVSLKDLADQSGVDESRVQAIMLGRWTPSPQERRQIADVLGCSVDDIAWGHVTPIQHLYGHGPG